MSLFPLASSVIDSFLTFFFLGIFTLKFSKLINNNQHRSFLIYIWHSTFSIIYAKYVLAYGGDAFDYYVNSSIVISTPSFGTDGIIFFTSIFSNLLGLSFVATSFIYGFFGYIGLLAFDASINAITYNSKPSIKTLKNIIIFLPSISFWSGGIGKDSLSFMASGLALWACLKLDNRFLALIFSMSIMFFVRPHIGGIMITSFIIQLILQKNISILKRIILIIFFFLPTLAAIPFAMQYSGIGEASSARDVSEYIETRQSHNQIGGGSVDITNMPLPLQILTYLFRPLPFEVTSIASLAASFDNTVLLILFIFGFWRFTVKKYKPPIPNKLFMFFYTSSCLTILSMTTSNLGISIRQKWMFVPFLIFILLSHIVKIQNNKGSI